MLESPSSEAFIANKKRGPRYTFIGHLQQGDCQEIHSKNIVVRVLATVVDIAPCIAESDYRVTMNNGVAKQQRITLDDGTGIMTVVRKDHHSTADHPAGVAAAAAPPLELGCLVDCLMTEVSSWTIQTMVVVLPQQRLTMETLRWMQLSSKDAATTTTALFPPPASATITTNRVLELILHAGNGVSMDDLALVLDVSSESSSIILYPHLQTLQSMGQIYQTQDSTYLPL